MIKPLPEPYSPRPCHFLGLWEFGPWRLKAYSIVYGGGDAAPELLARARQLAAERLAESAGATAHYHAGFIGIHKGKTADFIFIDWWADHNELHHHVYVAPPAQVTEFRYVTPTGLTACVWDLQLMAFERSAWVTATQSEDAPLEHYLSQRFDGLL